MTPAEASTLEPTRGGPTGPPEEKRSLIDRVHFGEFSRFTGLAIWAVFIAIFALWIPDTFLTSATAKSIAGDQAITAILAIGVLFTLAAGAYDLSIAQNLGLSAVVSASLMVHSGVS